MLVGRVQVHVVERGLLHHVVAPGEQQTSWSLEAITHTAARELEEEQEEEEQKEED